MEVKISSQWQPRHLYVNSSEKRETLVAIKDTKIPEVIPIEFSSNAVQHFWSRFVHIVKRSWKSASKQKRFFPSKFYMFNLSRELSVPFPGHSSLKCSTSLGKCMPLFNFSIVVLSKHTGAASCGARKTFSVQISTFLERRTCNQGAHK